MMDKDDFVAGFFISLVFMVAIIFSFSYGKDYGEETTVALYKAAGVEINLEEFRQ
jgi:hypothetical protein